MIDLERPQPSGTGGTTAGAPPASHILVVDDHAAARYALRRHLEREGFAVLEAGDGTSALELIASAHVDLVVLDVNLPDISGFEICRRLRAAPETRALPVMQLSATAIDVTSQVVGLEAGADAYLVEPVDRAVLVATIRALLRAARAERKAEDRAREWQVTFDSITNPVCLLDPAGKVVRANRAFAALVGRTAPSDCIGEPFEAAIDPDGVAPELRLAFAASGDGGPQAAEGLVRGRWNRLTLDPIVDDRGEMSGIAVTLTDLEDRRSAEVDLGRALENERSLADAADSSRRLLETIVEQLPVALVVVDARSRRVVLANAEVGRILGSGFEAGAPLSAFADYPGYRRDGRRYEDSELPLVRALTSGEVVTNEEIELIRTDGSHEMVSVSAGPVRDETNEVVAAVATFVDVTARWESEALREVFISVLSHELRTPITTIYAGTRLLLKASPSLTPATRTEVLDDVAAEAERLERLVENLLVLVRIERGIATVEREPVLIQRLIERVVAEEAPRWPATHFQLELPLDLPTVAGDEALAELIARNLLSNAAKYGPAGGTVTVRAAQVEGEVVVRVLDEGPGIPAGREQDIFRVFFRARETSALAPGAGIGLFIARSLAEQMGGRIVARNRPEGGAEFALTLPLFEE